MFGTIFYFEGDWVPFKLTKMTKITILKNFNFTNKIVLILTSNNMHNRYVLEKKKVQKLKSSLKLNISSCLNPTP